ncbi:MAG: ribonuclease D [Alphaproteobacteria bacterium]|nr:ribonuclease D [Alphaproteobacteria bacterium]
MTHTLYTGDIPAELSFGRCVAIDTESMGLNVGRDRLCLIQMSSGDGNAHLVKFKRDEYDAPNLKKLLLDPSVIKLFHFARSDLAMIYKYLGIMPTPVYCTKIASVFVRTFSDRHGLKDLCRDLLGIDLSKEQQTSDWGAAELTKEQLSYAASDVLHLHKLKEILDERLVREGRADLARKVMDFLPVRAELDVVGWANADIFAHKPTRRPD